MSSKSLEIDMCAGSQLRDTQGEMLDVSGADISELEAGRGRINDNHGKGFFNTLGKVISAKKIFKAEDCEDDRQRYYWEKVKSPYVYVKAELFNDEDHPNAKAAAAILRNVHKTDCPLKVKASVEGGVVSRGLKDPTLLARTKIHSVALTFVPANQATLVEPLNLTKSEINVEADMILIKSVMHLAQTDVPSFRHITRAASAEKIEQNINKIMSALGKEVPADLKQELIKASLERKIADNIVNINRLVKTAAGPKHIHVDSETEPNKGEPEWMHEWGEWGDSDNEVRSMFPDAMPDYESWKRAIQETPVDSKTDWSNLHPSNTNPTQFKNIEQAREHAWNQHKERFDNDRNEFDNYFTKLVSAVKLGNVRPSLVGVHKDPQTGKQTEYLIGGNSRAKIHNALGIPTPVRHLPLSGRMVPPKTDSLEVEKALTAGYGGAGAPTNLTGGSVLQSESQELGPKGLAFITCEHCGKEQVYGKFQVKCREPDCGKAFSMNKLEKFFQMRRK